MVILSKAIKALYKKKKNRQMKGKQGFLENKEKHLNSKKKKKKNYMIQQTKRMVTLSFPSSRVKKREDRERGEKCTVWKVQVT